MKRDASLHLAPYLLLARVFAALGLVLTGAQPCLLTDV